MVDHNNLDLILTSIFPGPGCAPGDPSCCELPTCIRLGRHADMMVE